MAHTTLNISGESFQINGKPTYSDIPQCKVSCHGLLMNARFIQGVFDDRSGRERYARWGKACFDPERNTDDLIAALPEWHSYGLRAFTVGFQGGGPCYTTDNYTIHNNPYGSDGSTLDTAYAARMDRLIRGADAAGMVVIVSLFYGAQTRFLADARAVRDAVETASRFIRDGGYTNVIIELANEHNIDAFKGHPILHTAEGVVLLMDIARNISGVPIGCSGGGGYSNREIAQASDVVLIHGNGLSRQGYYNLITVVKSWGLNKPIVCNEDSNAIGQLSVALDTGTSWGYYNNTTKQEPPAEWGITCGEDLFFALRMAKGLGIPVTEPAFEDQFYLQGLEPTLSHQGMRWVRLASLYPEKIDHVEFYVNNSRVYINYDEPFSVNWVGNWIQRGYQTSPGDVWEAVVHLTDGQTLSKRVIAAP